MPDVASDADLDALVARADEPLWIGARGLAFALARRGRVASPDGAEVPGPVMIANGSRDPLTLAQVAAITGPILPAPDGTAPNEAPPAGPFVVTMTDSGGGLTGAEAARRFAATIVALARTARPATLLVCAGETAQAVLDRLGIAGLEVIAEVRPGLPLCLIETPWGQVRMLTKSGGFGAADLLAGILETAE